MRLVGLGLWAACRPAGAPPGPAPTAPTPGTDTAAPEAPTPVLDDEHVLVVPDAEGLHWVDRAGAIVWSRPWAELVGGPCDPCGGEGASADDDGLLVSFTTGGFDGAVARIDAGGAAFRVDGFVFPHDVVRDPRDRTLIVAETLADRIRWIPGDGSSDTTLRRLDQGTTGAAELPNGLDRVDAGDATYLLATYRGSTTVAADGTIVLWDVSTADPTFVWQFPPEGRLATPHGAALRRVDGRWWLVWAHTDGAPPTGSVGVAVTDALPDPPQYVADLVPLPPQAPFVFLKGVELTADGALYLTDSGAPGGVGDAPVGRVIRSALPAGLAPAGATGSVEDQVRVALPPPIGGQPEALLDGRPNPFEAWLWRPTF